MEFQKNPYPHHERSLEIPRGRVVLKAKILKAKLKNEAKLEFSGGRGIAKQKTFCEGGGVQMFSGNAHC